MSLIYDRDHDNQAGPKLVKLETVRLLSVEHLSLIDELALPPASQPYLVSQISTPKGSKRETDLTLMKGTRKKSSA